MFVFNEQPCLLNATVVELQWPATSPQGLTPNLVTEMNITFFGSTSMYIPILSILSKWNNGPHVSKVKSCKITIFAGKTTKETTPLAKCSEVKRCPNPRCVSPRSFQRRRVFQWLHQLRVPVAPSALSGRTAKEHSGLLHVPVYLSMSKKNNSKCRTIFYEIHIYKYIYILYRYIGGWSEFLYLRAIILRE